MLVAILEELDAMLSDHLVEAILHKVFHIANIITQKGPA